jgi:predicted RNA-binding protein with PUA-like domain
MTQRMNYWLFKEEPTHYSYDDLVKDGSTAWEGVHNNLALKNLRLVKKGDQIFYYHTGDEKAVVGIMKALGDAYSAEAKVPLATSKEVGVKVGPLRKLENSVSLQEIKSSAKFKNFLLVKISRLSVMPVKNEQWEEILKMSLKSSTA